MSKSYSIRESARLLGVAPSTISRHIPRNQVRHGHRAALTERDVLDLATEFGKDADVVRRRIDLDLEFESGMPDEATRWLELAQALDLPRSVHRHETRIPARYWSDSVPPLTEFDFAEAPVGAVEWTPLTIEALDDLIPPDKA
jgi:hypothetical protein